MNFMKIKHHFSVKMPVVKSIRYFGKDLGLQVLGQLALYVPAHDLVRGHRQDHQQEPT